MRRNSFLIGALTALVTFVALSAFVHRPWGWRYRWGYNRCYYNDGDRPDRNMQNRRSNNNAGPTTDTTTYSNQ